MFGKRVFLSKFFFDLLFLSWKVVFAWKIKINGSELNWKILKVDLDLKLIRFLITNQTQVRIFVGKITLFIKIIVKKILRKMFDGIKSSVNHKVVFVDSYTLQVKL